ncbi:MAG: TraR/DksA C4-type zinc finger protein [Pseudomonadota bacterium]
MKKKDLKEIAQVLEARRAELINVGQNFREGGIGVEQADLPDEVDLASSESDQAMNLRLRDRELFLYKKINAALEKIKEGNYGICESCGEEIGFERLKARPVTDLCIRCKEEEERREKGFAE